MPPDKLEPYPWQGEYPLPTGQGAPPLGGGGCPSLAPYPEGEGVGGGASLVPYYSITPTAIKYPSDIAKDALLLLDGKNPYYKTCFDFVCYLDLCEQKGFLIKGYDTKKGKTKFAHLEYGNRWGGVRRKILSLKLGRLASWFDMQTDRPVTMVTLTSYQNNLSVPSAWFELNKGKKKLLDLIRKYFGDVDYFWVVEPHKSGYAHYHLAVFADIDNETKDKKGKGIEDKLRDLWSNKYKVGSHTFGLDFSKKKDDKKIRDLKNYLQKYLRKGFLLDKWTPGMLKFNTAMWETGFRMYGASKNIREIMKLENKKPSQTVWLETKMECPEETPEGVLINVDKVIWYRQYIPDWLDSDFWIWKKELREVDPPPQYIFDWGRKSTNKPLDIIHVWQGRGNFKTQDPYEQFNKDYANRHKTI